MTKLNDPTPSDEIKTRQGPGGRQLSYIDARFVMDRLDAAVGPENWQDRYEDRVDGSVRCGIGILVHNEDDPNEWVWKWDVGDTSEIEPTKGAYSDAFKRAAVKWGIGRDLYGDHASQKPATRPTAAPTPVRRPEPTQSAPALTEDEWAGLVDPPPPLGERVTFGGGPGLNSRDFFERLDTAQIDRKEATNTAKKMFGASKWKILDLTDEERLALWEELRAVPA